MRESYILFQQNRALEVQVTLAQQQHSQQRPQRSPHLQQSRVSVHLHRRAHLREQCSIQFWEQHSVQTGRAADRCAAPPLFSFSFIPSSFSSFHRTKNLNLEDWELRPDQRFWPYSMSKKQCYRKEIFERSIKLKVQSSIILNRLCKGKFRGNNF